jgi:cytochrome c oxidase cbb3-type subunit 1
LLWWAALLLSGWIAFLPGVLDRIKFGSGLVAHSHLAMAGFTSAFCILLLSTLLPAARRAFAGAASAWNAAVIVHVAALTVAGWLEGANREWMNDSPPWRHACFGLRWCAGAAMLAVAVIWWRAWRKETSKPLENDE